MDAYRKAGKSIRYYDQTRSLTQIRRECEGWSDYPAHLQRGTLKRLHRTFERYFDRISKGESPGHPRYKASAQFTSFEFSEWLGITLKKNRVYFRGVPGGLRLHFHRPLPPDVQIKTVSFKKSINGWAIYLHAETKLGIPKPLKRAVGIDLGIASFATLSSGEVVPSLFAARCKERILRRKHRALSRCKRGSRRRERKRGELSRAHAKVVNIRRTYLHQASARLVREHALIAVEKLNVRKMVKGSKFAKKINDVAWSTFREMLRYKALKAGTWFIEVDPAFTSQMCSRCGVIVPKDLSVRRHECPHCALSLDRDHNAAINILYRAVAGPRVANLPVTAG